MENRVSILQLIDKEQSKGYRLELPKKIKNKGVKINVLALGDVGANVLLGLKVLGGDSIKTIGIYDLDAKQVERYRQEINQIGWPFEQENLPEVKRVTEKNLFDCHIFIFCASKGVPPVGANGDMRMVQLEANRKIAEEYGKKATLAKFEGIFAVVSDPVDNLCKIVLDASELRTAQIRGYGLGVMNKRAEFFAREDEKFASYLREGRAYGPHGQDLVIANSVENYDETLSLELTDLTVSANMKVRELGFKPFLAPAFSSAVMPILLTIQGQWHYSSVYVGDKDKGAFLGIKNRVVRGKSVELEDIPLPKELFLRIKKSYDRLCNLK